MVAMELTQLVSVAFCIKVYGFLRPFDSVSHTLHVNDKLYGLNVKVVLRHSGTVS